MKAVAALLIFILSLQSLAKAPAPQDLKAYDQFLFTPNSLAPTPGHRRNGKRTDGALIVLNGRTIFEKYARGYNADREHIMWSTSKTIMALLYGVAMLEHRVKLNQSICDFVASHRPGQCKITIADLLQWSSALDWSEEYENGDILGSSVIDMLYGHGHRNMASYVLDHPLERSVVPGRSWRYSSGDSILLSKILQKVFGVPDLRPIFEQKLFLPLGIRHATWESDEAGTIGGAFYFYCTARELEKIGELFLRDGRANGQQVVAPDFIQFMQTVPASFTLRRPDDLHIHHVSGAHLWVNKPAGVPNQKLYVPQPWPFAPADTIATIGHWGQYLVVIPSLNLVAVRIGDTRDTSFPIDNFIKQTVNLVKGLNVDASSGQSAVPVAQSISNVHTMGPSPSLLWKLKAAPLALGFGAKMACSCLFVSQSSEPRCRKYAFVEQIPNVRLKIDYQHKSVETAIPWLSLFLHETAAFQSTEKGCVLE